jgi:hypothetical protein
MQLDTVKPYLETSGDMGAKHFEIEDLGMMFEIVRNKMYSNPILSICREISCNARDAHREVGKFDVPIQISLPNALSPYYKIKDFGPGINPERMEKVYRKYTASTKRLSNLQTGGFGLGAKTPFSYSDTFNVITVTDGVQRTYACVIDETKVGAVLLMEEVPTDEENGTEISIPVLPANFHEFREYTERACRYWDVKPIIKGSTIEWQIPPQVMKGDKWMMVAKSYDRGVKAIIDGIEYTLDMATLNKYVDCKLVHMSHSEILLFFGVGELSLSASREQVHLDEKTQEAIRARLLEAENDVKRAVADEINKCDDLWKANLYYRLVLTKSFSSLNFLGNMQWNGIDLNDRYCQTTCPTYSFAKGKTSYRRSKDPNKLYRHMAASISFEEGSELYINDIPTLKEPTPRHIKKAFDDNPNLRSLQVVCPTAAITLADLEKKINISQMKPKLLSTITKATRNYTASASRLILFKFDSVACAFRQVSYATLDSELNIKVLCPIRKSGNNNREVYIDGRYWDVHKIQSLAKHFPQATFYGVDSDSIEKNTDDLTDFQELSEFLDENLVEANQFDFIKIKVISKHYSLDTKMISQLAGMKRWVTDANSLFIKRLELHAEFQKVQNECAEILSLYESFKGAIESDQTEEYLKNNPDMDLDKLNDKYKAQYPLMNHLNHYYGSDTIFFKNVAQYVNLIDKEQGNNNGNATS